MPQLREADVSPAAFYFSSNCIICTPLLSLLGEHIDCLLPRRPVVGGAGRRGAPWEGRPPRGPVGGGRTRRGAGGGDRLGWGHPQKIIQSPDRLYKAPTDYTKNRKTIQSPEKTIQRHKILDRTNKMDHNQKTLNKSSNEY